MRLISAVPSCVAVDFISTETRNISKPVNRNNLFQVTVSRLFWSASLLANENNLTLGLGSAACFFDADGKRIDGFDGSRRMETRTNETVIGD